MCAVLATTTYAQNTVGSGITGLIKSGQLQVGTLGTAPPFSMRGKFKEHDVDGLEIRLVYEIARRLGLTYVPVLVSWEGVLPGVAHKSFDFSSVIMDITEKRKETVDFVPWLEENTCLIGRSDTPLSKFDNFSELTVGAVIATTFAALAKEKGAKEIRYYKNENDAFLDLTNGNIDAVVTEELIGEYAVKTEKLPLKVIGTPLNPTPILKGWAFRKDSEKLRDAVSAALAEMKADGTYKKIIAEVLNSSHNNN